MPWKRGKGDSDDVLEKKKGARPEQRLALASYGGNTAQYSTTLTLKKGAEVLFGTVARAGKYLGGGLQYYVPNLLWLV